MTVQVALLGHPVAHSLSPRRQNAAFAAAGLDWHYAAFDVEDPLAAVAALRTLGFAGTNVTIPHKRAVVAVCDEADGEAVNTLVFRDGRVLGFNTDKEILAGINATRACLIGAGGAAQTLARALPADTRVFTRRGEWPPDASGCDLIVNATPVRDELLVEPLSRERARRRFSARHCKQARHKSIGFLHSVSFVPYLAVSVLRCTPGWRPMP